MPVRSTPMWVRVWAMPGLMPEMMHSAPSRRTARAILMKWSAVLVSITSMPVMSTIAIRACLATIVSSSVSVISALRWLSTMPTTGRQRTPAQTSMIGVDSSRIAACCISIVSSLASSSRLIDSCWASARLSSDLASPSSRTKMENAVSSSENSSLISPERCEQGEAGVELVDARVGERLDDRLQALGGDDDVRAPRFEPYFLPRHSKLEMIARTLPAQTSRAGRRSRIAPPPRCRRTRSG